VHCATRNAAAILSSRPKPRRQHLPADALGALRRRGGGRSFHRPLGGAAVVLRSMGFCPRYVCMRRRPLATLRLVAPAAAYPHQGQYTLFILANEYTHPEQHVPRPDAPRHRAWRKKNSDRTRHRHAVGVRWQIAATR